MHQLCELVRKYKESERHDLPNLKRLWTMDNLSRYQSEGLCD